MNKFLKEIMEQPRALQDTLDYYQSEAGLKSLEAVKQIIASADLEQVIFTGMGSSYFTSHAAATIFDTLGICAFKINASQLLHYNSSLLNYQSLLVCFSQSGESFEIRELLKIRPPQTKCVGITNEAEGTLARKADVALICKAGKEEMTSTKTYVCTSMVAYILAWYLGDQWNEDKAREIEGMINGFKNMLYDDSQLIPDAIDFLGALPALQLIARGPAFSTACQSGLMFKEALAVAATGYLGGEFRHGPMEMVGEDFKAILFAAQGRTYEQSIKMARDIAHFGGKLILITNKQNEVLHPNIFEIFIDQDDEELFAIQSIIPIQLFIDAFAKQKGFEAGSFTHGAKVTMVE